MGNSESTNLAAASAAGNAVSDAIKKQKRRAKRLGCCCCWTNVAGVVFMIVGIILLVHYAASLSDSYTKDDRDLAKGLTYTGIALLILGLLLLLIGVIVAVVACMIYRRMTGGGGHKPDFKHKQYAPGTAPYPQQDWGEQSDPRAGQTSQPAQPGETAATAPPQVDMPLIHPEIRSTNSDAPLIEPDPDAKRAPEPAADPEAIKPEIS